MKKFIRILLLVFVVLFTLGLLMLYIKHEPLPKTSTPQQEKAEQVALQILNRINHKGWDSLHYLTFTFKGTRSYVWDKQSNYAQVKWDENDIRLNLNEKVGTVYISGQAVSGEEATSLIDKAWSYWCNDSFWMFAPFKINDEGTERSMVIDSTYGEGLMVTYTSGGVTPGDSYLWFYDDTYRPTGYKMWVKIIPIGGTYFSWEEWTTLPCGAELATLHTNEVATLTMTNVAEGTNLQILGLPDDLFSTLQ